jgi:hypothetical protein
MNLHHVTATASSSKRAVRRRAHFDPTAAMLAATLMICVATAVALYTLGH